MKNVDIINKIGRDFLVTSNGLEKPEFSYADAFKKAGKEFKPIYNNKGNRKYNFLDLRFVKGNVSVLVEEKEDFDFDKTAEEQLSAYIEYEKVLTGNKIVAILANTGNPNDERIKVWRGSISDYGFMPKETEIRSIDEYVDFYSYKSNNKETVMKQTYALNELLHECGIKEKIRSQFVGTCLLALKNGLSYDIDLRIKDTQGLSKSEIEQKEKEKSEDVNSQIRAGIVKILGRLLADDDMNKLRKLALLNTSVIDNQDIRQLDAEKFIRILKFIDTNILPHINDKSTAGQDLLNLFFITFNKYVGKEDKNQAFTPDHITDFMTKITGVDRNTVVLDPCCGSGAFLVRAMTQALDDCSNKAQEDEIKKKHIYGIEYDENVYGLAATNMLIHGDGNSNIQLGSCFDLKEWIKKVSPDVILMNPPYNATKKTMPTSFTNTWRESKKEDPTKGLYFVKYIADIINELGKQATLAVLLPVACAIGSSKEIEKVKTELLEKNTLDAVFTMPGEMFYPGASASACCMVFKLGKRHDNKSNPDTYFGYYKEDGFKKKKNLGRIEQEDKKTGKSIWEETEKEWIDLYRNRKAKDGLSAVHKVTGSDEWLCEAYMKTDYSKLTDADFQQTLNNYLAYLVKEGFVYEA